MNRVTTTTNKRHTVKVARTRLRMWHAQAMYRQHGIGMTITGGAYGPRDK